MNKFWLGLCLGLVAVPVMAEDKEAETPPTVVQLAEVSRESMSPQIWVPGSVMSKQDAKIAAEVAGRLVSVKEVGDTVAAGEILASVDDRALELEVRRGEATVKRLHASLDYQRKQLERLQKLAAVNGAAKTQLDEAVSQKSVAEQQLAEAEADLDSHRYDLERTRVRAPYAGRVVERLAQPGEYIGAGTPVVRLVDTQNVEIRVVAPLYVAPFLREGQSVSIRALNQELASSIHSLVPVGDERSRMFEVRVALKPGAWPIGNAVRVALPTEAPRDVVAVPRDALILREDGTYVFKIGPKMIAERVNVHTGSGVGELVEIDGAVSPGDKVVVRGGENLQAGQTVKPQLN